MAIDLGKYLVYGELWNNRKNSVHGWLGLLGLSCKVQLDLTGNCDPDLYGKHLRFKTYRFPDEAFDERSIPHFQIRQVGPVVKATAALRVRVDAAGRVLPPSAEAVAGSTWRPCLHLEWFCQHGRVTIDLVDAVIQVVGPEEADDPDSFFGDVVPALDDAGPPEALLGGDADGPDQGTGSLSAALVPPDLEAELERRSALLGATPSDPEDVSECIREMELMDDLIESGTGVPLQVLIGVQSPLPDPATLDEEMALIALRGLLARLAVRGIAVDMCEHVSALETYRLLLTEIGAESHCYPEMQGTGWVQHFSTSDYCTLCEAELERSLAGPDDPGPGTP